MNLYEHSGKRPRIDPSARIAPTAVLCGDVTVGPNASAGFGAVLTAESGRVSVGANSVVMDTAVIRGVRRNPVAIGDNVLVGPRAYLTGCTVEDNAFLATGVTVFNGAVIGKGSEIRINGVVHIRTVLPPGTMVPIGWVAVGSPAKVLPPSEHEAIWEVQRPLDFPKYVFGVERPGEGETMMPTVMSKYARMLNSHKEDKTLPARRAG